LLTLANIGILYLFAWKKSVMHHNALQSSIPKVSSISYLPNAYVIILLKKKHYRKGTSTERIAASATPAPLGDF